MKTLHFVLIAAVLFLGCKEKNSHSGSASVIADGQMPNMTKDRAGKLHLVYGSGDSLMYTFSDNGGETFATPALVTVLPELAASHTRGPQIASTNDGLILTACVNSGNIFSFQKDASGKWQKAIRVNDADTVAKENLMALAADGQNAFAAWLDLRNGQNQI